MQPFKVQAGQRDAAAVIFPICHTSEVQILSDGSHWFAGLPVSVFAGIYSGWTAHLDAQSMQAGLHYMLCLDLDGVLWMAFGCHVVPHGAAVLRFEVQVIFQIFQKSWVKHDLKI